MQDNFIILWSLRVLLNFFYLVVWTEGVTIVCILASQRNGTLYIGLTCDLVRRIWEHKNKFVPGFTEKYSVTTLVYYEIFNDIKWAAAREKRLKEWKRQWKIDLIEKMNPNWQDLYQEIVR